MREPKFSFKMTHAYYAEPIKYAIFDALAIAVSILFGLFIRTIIMSAALFVGIEYAFDKFVKKKNAAPMLVEFFEDYVVFTIFKLPDASELFKIKAKIHYEDLEKCKFYEKSKRVFIMGNIEKTIWVYNQDGTLDKNIRKYNNSAKLFSFNVSCEKNMRWKKCLEEYLPLYFASNY